jgi:predicted DCC family thiol-disulfide oxidoreductase YuxK
MEYLRIPMKRLYVFYDFDCPICRRCRDWLARQTAYLPLEFWPYQWLEHRPEFRFVMDLQPEQQLVVVTDTGDVHQGAAAWMLCLYALKAYRVWAIRLSTPMLKPMAQRVVTLLSANRYALSKLLLEDDDRRLAEALNAATEG